MCEDSRNRVQFSFVFFNKKGKSSVFVNLNTSKPLFKGIKKGNSGTIKASLN